LLFFGAMTMLPTTASLSASPTWDGDRRMAGGALAGDPPALKGDDEFSFGDFLSIINPLQHIPVVSNLYRWVTGDTIKPAARVIGGAIYGGPVGLVASAINAVVEEVKGSDIGAQLIALVSPDKKSPDAAPPAAVAAAAEEKTAPAEGAEALLQFAADMRKAEPPAEVAPKAKESAAPAAAPTLSGQARTLAFYQAHAGQRVPAFDNGRSGPPQKYSLPIASQAGPVSKPLPLPAAEDKSGTAEAAVPQNGTPDAWFASAMMRGLDRYRASQQLNKLAPQVDVSQ
jgi:hypothetical protein